MKEHFQESNLAHERENEIHSQRTTNADQDSILSLRATQLETRKLRTAALPRHPLPRSRILRPRSRLHGFRRGAT